jgi:hypothetical protein
MVPENLVLVRSHIVLVRWTTEIQCDCGDKLPKVESVVFEWKHDVTSGFFSAFFRFFRRSHSTSHEWSLSFGLRLRIARPPSARNRGKRHRKRGTAPTQYLTSLASKNSDEIRVD